MELALRAPCLRLPRPLPPGSPWPPRPRPLPPGLPRPLTEISIRAGSSSREDFFGGVEGKWQACHRRHVERTGRRNRGSRWIAASSSQCRSSCTFAQTVSLCGRQPLPFVPAGYRTPSTSASAGSLPRRCRRGSVPRRTRLLPRQNECTVTRGCTLWPSCPPPRCQRASFFLLAGGSVWGPRRRAAYTTHVVVAGTRLASAHAREVVPSGLQSDV